MLKIVIADNQQIAKPALVAPVLTELGATIEAEATSIAEILQLLKSKRCDAVLLNIDTPSGEGLTTLERLKTLHPDLHVVAVSGSDDAEKAMRAYKLGADGFLTKQSTNSEYTEAIRLVTAGRKHVPQFVAESLVTQMATPRKDLAHNKLSNREHQILLMLGQGHRNIDIARELSLSPKTVSAHKTRLMVKMRFDNDIELAKYLVDRGLVR